MLGGIFIVLILNAAGAALWQMIFWLGASMFDDDSLDAEELIRITDDRMYISKAQGKNNYTFLDS